MPKPSPWRFPLQFSGEFEPEFVRCCEAPSIVKIFSEYERSGGNCYLLMHILRLLWLPSAALKTPRPPKRLLRQAEASLSRLLDARLDGFALGFPFLTGDLTRTRDMIRALLDLSRSKSRATQGQSTISRHSLAVALLAKEFRRVFVGQPTKWQWILDLSKVVAPVRFNRIYVSSETIRDLARKTSSKATQDHLKILTILTTWPGKNGP